MIELTVAQIAEIVGGAVADISPQDAAHRRVTGTAVPRPAGRVRPFDDRVELAAALEALERRA
nr:hypothetical protein [Mycobacterium tuberculosis]